MMFQITVLSGMQFHHIFIEYKVVILRHRYVGSLHRIARNIRVGLEVWPAYLFARTFCSATPVTPVTPVTYLCCYLSSFSADKYY